MTTLPGPRSPNPDGHQASCRSIEQMVDAYLDGECDSETAARVAAHLEVCPSCAGETRVFDAIKQTLATGRCCGSDPEAVAKLSAYAKRLSQD